MEKKLTVFKEIDPSFTDRIKFICDKVGNVSKISKLSGISATAINKYRNGLSDPSRSNLISLSNAAEVDVGWLATGNGDHCIGKTTSNQYVSVPVLDVEACAGHGIPAEYEAVSDVMQLNEAWLMSTFHVNPKSVTILPIKGDSMEPTIRSGELVLIEKMNTNNIPSDGIYVIRVEGAVAVKRLQFLPNHCITVSSDNKLFPPYNIIPEDGADFTILGRVLAGLRSL